MHSMVGSFSPYAVKRQRVDMVRGYCYRFFQCSFPCGIVMLILSILFILVGISQLIYIFQFDGCNSPMSNDEETNTDPSSVTLSSTLSSSSTFKCNRHTMKVVGITFIGTGSVLLLISLLITKYSRSSEENNVIRTTTTSLVTNNTKPSNLNHPLTHHHHPSSSSFTTHDPNHMVVSIR